ncbi:two-component regulator propeller domain-containing protein [Lewinella sp. LCG006]|uniref:two-component regulator propeller domain-containing protein n=1 Tax=Lewinella sp. LCG006 TaxID=3231911 RepID=UPI0034613076
MRWHPVQLTILSLLLVFFSSCEKQQQISDRHPQEIEQTTQKYFKTGAGNQILTGIPVKIKGKVIGLTPQTLQQHIPVNIETETVAFANKQVIAGNPTVIKASPKVLSKKADRRDTLVPAKGRKITASIPVPLQVLPAKTEDDAISDIRYWSLDQNLSTASFWTMAQDRRGDLWLGSLGGGAIRFDGIHFEHFTTKEGLVSNHVFAILEDRKGNIWFGTQDGGVSKFDGTTFTNFNTENGLLHNFVLCLLEDHQGNIWMGTRGGLSRYDGNGFVHFTAGNGLLYNEVIALFEDSKQQLWIGTGEGTGIYRFHEGTFTHYNIGMGKGDNDAHSIIETRDGNLWFGTWGGGAVKYDGTNFYKFTTDQGLSSNNVLSIFEDKQGSLWFGNMRGGVTEYNGQTFVHYTDDSGLSSNNVRYILQDDQENIWACTWDTGINRISKSGFQQFINSDKLGKTQIDPITVDQKQQLWLATDLGFSRFDGDSFKHYQSAKSIIREGVLTICEDDQQNIWLGAGGGVSKFNGTELTDFTRASGLLVGDVRAIHQDQHGQMWFGGFASGIVQFNGDRFLQFTEAEGFPSNDLNCIYEDKAGHLWFGTQGGGVSRFDGTHFIHYTTNEGLSNNFVQDILEDHEGNIWLGTKDGLNKFDGQTFTSFYTQDGLSHNTIYSLLLDEADKLWVKTPRGISLLVETSAKAVSAEAHEEKKFNFINYNKEDGLKASDLTANNLLLYRQNHLLVGTDNGLKSINPNQYQSAQYPPRHLKLTNLEINQSFVDYQGLLAGTTQIEAPAMSKLTAESSAPFYNLPQQLVLPHQLNHLTFHFSAIDWSAPAKIRYSYKLEGIDQHWSLAQGIAKADYRNLPTGYFTLKVKAVGMSGIWSPPISYSFRIRPPWWKMWWAYAIYLTVLCLLSYRFYQFMLSRKLAIAEKNRLQEINALKSSIYTNVTHEFRTPLTVINGMVEELEKTQQSEVILRTQVIKTHSKRLLDMVNHLMQLAKLEIQKETLNLEQGDIIAYLGYIVASHELMAQTKNIDLHFSAQPDKLWMDFDAQKITTILTNLIANATKFTPKNGEISVNAEKIAQAGKPYLMIKVADNGVGIAANELPLIFNKFYQASSKTKYTGTGIGLALVKGLVLLMDGHIDVQSALNEGTTFSIVLPVQQKTTLAEVPNHPTKFPAATIEAADPHTNGTDDEQPLVLIIEDNVDIVNYLQSCLREEAYQVLIEYNGLEGMATAFEAVPDLIITDIMMPGIDGYELCRRLKEDERTNHIPIIMLTARVAMDEKIAGLAAGADAYITKPFEKREVLIRLEKLLHLRKTLQQVYLTELKASFELNQINKHSKHPFIQKVEQEILSNLANEDFSVNELSRALLLSRSQLNRKIKAATGMNTSIFIRHIRLLEARKLLQSSSYTVSEVVYAVGFNSPAYFSQAYKHEFGHNPSEETK